jgi:hypothetical protein
MTLRCLIAEAGLVVAGMMVGSGVTMLVDYHTPPPAPAQRIAAPTPAVVASDEPGVAIGRQLAPRVLDSLAQGFDVAADALSQGKDVETADGLLKERFATARSQAFAEVAGPALARVVPEGSEPTPANRDAFVRLHRGIAQGLRGAR